jgi:hypothetical protein
MDGTAMAVGIEGVGYRYTTASSLSSTFSFSVEFLAG